MVEEVALDAKSGKYASASAVARNTYAAMGPSAVFCDTAKFGSGSSKRGFDLED